MATNGSELEIELTYLARFVPEEIKSVEPLTMEDVYYPATSGKRSILRLRRQNERYEITKKAPLTEGDGSQHMETTIVLDRDEYDALYTAPGKNVRKLRYQIKLNGVAAEVDLFTGSLEGLVTIDFEFSSVEGMEAFTPPDCCLVEVTHERFIRGGEIAGKAYADIITDLDRLDYKRL